VGFVANGSTQLLNLKKNMAHPRSICDTYLEEFHALGSTDLAHALLDFDEDVLFVDVFRAYMSRRTVLPRELGAPFYRRVLEHGDTQWLRLLHTKIEEEREDDAAFYKLEGKSLEDLIDPITLELPVLPVGTVHGRIYEDAGLREWLKGHDTDPCTRQFLREYDKKPLEVAAEWILKTEPRTEEEGEKKARWCEKRGDHLFRAGKYADAALELKHVPSMVRLVDRMFSMLEYNDDPDSCFQYKTGTCERILLLAAEAEVEKALMCLGLLEMQKARPDFDRGIEYFGRAETFINSIQVDMRVFEALMRCKEFERAALWANAISSRTFQITTANKEAFQFLADCLLYGKHGVEMDVARARHLLRTLRKGGHLDDMQVKYAHMLLTGLGGDQDVLEGMMLLRNCMACAGEAQDLFAQVSAALSSVVCVRERHGEYVEARNAKRRLVVPE